MGKNSDIDITKVPTTSERMLPVFSEFDRVAERIRQRAYEMFEGHGYGHGDDLAHWFRAEREICWPAAELVEEDDEYEIKVALAGFEAGDITVTATPHEIIVKAMQEQEERDEDEKVLWSEFRREDVYRRFTLPGEVDVDGIEAEFKRGILEIEAPKPRKRRAAKADSKKSGKAKRKATKAEGNKSGKKKKKAAKKTAKPTSGKSSTKKKPAAGKKQAATKKPSDKS